jgi:hypothetical protein
VSRRCGRDSEEGDGDASGDDACTGGGGGVRAPDGTSRLRDGSSSDETARTAVAIVMNYWQTSYKRQNQIMKIN